MTPPCDMQLFADRLPALTKMQPALNGRMIFFAAGLSYKTAPVELRERLAVNAAQLGHCASRLKLCAGLDEIVLLSTCNRVEIYGTTQHSTGCISSLFESLSQGPCDFRPHVYVHENLEAVSHLFRVATGLDSLALGETEIIGQVKNAYDIARAARLTSSVLNRIFQESFRVVKEIRTRTGIGRGSTSVGGLVAGLAEKIYHAELSIQSVMIIGAGKMGEACLRHLAKKGAGTIVVSNRAFDHAIALAKEFNGRAVRFDERLAAMAEADIVITATGCPETLLRCADVEALMGMRRNRPLFLIDISVPRNIEPAAQFLDYVFLYNIDDLEALVRQNVHTREEELGLCHQIIASRAAALMDKVRLEKLRRDEVKIQTQICRATPGVAVFSS